MRLRVARRKRELRRLIARGGMVRVAWFQELAHLEETGRLDWVDPNPPPPPRPFGSSMKPPPRPR